MTEDPTLSDAAMYGSEKWVAATLGKSLDWLYRNREALEADGFPVKDRLLRLTIKADVIRWIEKRRRLSDAVAAAHHTAADTKSGVNYGNL